MMIESCYTVPLDQIPPDPLAEDEDPVYESLDEIASSQGSISNILGTVILKFVKFIQKFKKFCLSGHVLPVSFVFQAETQWPIEW